MNADLLDRALEELVERCDDSHGDWHEVLQRACVTTPPPLQLACPAPPRRQASSRRRLLGAAVAVCVLVFAVLMATPAFGVRDAVLGLFGRTNVPFKSGKPAPTLIRRQFSDLSFGIPPSMAPQAIVSQARTVATFHLDGKQHTLFVAPTRKGGFCWQMSGAFGGCLNLAASLRMERKHPYTARGAVQPELLSISYMDNRANTAVVNVEGVVLAAKASRLVAEFKDHKTIELPFIFVSPPINAGFLYWHVPKSHQSRATALIAIAAYDAKGKLLARSPIGALVPPRRIHIPLPTHVKPSPPPSPLGFHIPSPTAPLSHGSGDGVSITVGSNGVVVFNTTGLDAARRALMHGRLGIDCFHLSHDALGIWPRELGVVRSFGPVIKIQLVGMPKPYDGCEIQATYGHTWPDKFSSHSAVEVPLSNAGRRFFVDRAAARDLALFVRSKRGHALRKETDSTLARDLAKIRPRLLKLVSPTAALHAGRIGYTLSSDGVTFVEQSPAGQRFQIVISDGHIARQNVKPYAFVF